MKSRFLQSLRVLLVEDEEKLATLLESAIGGDFHSFTIAFNGEAGLQQYKKLSPDIVITDITMPKMSGLAMAKEIKKINSNIPIIILSAYSETEKLLNAIDVGVVKYFIKPFDPDEVLEYIYSLKDVFEEKLLQLCDDFSYSYEKNTLYKSGRYVFLSKSEQAFLQFMLNDVRENNKHILTNELIKKRLWGVDANDERLRTFIKRFRDKTSKNLIINIKRQGYLIAT